MVNALEASNDELIIKLFNDPHYRIHEDGVIETCVSRQGHITPNWRIKWIRTHENDYKSIKYFGVQLQYHRVMFYKYHGFLDKDKVINHINTDPGDNSKKNLELVSQSKNNSHAFRCGKKPVAGNVRYSQDIVDEIRLMRSTGATYSEIMAKFSVSKSSLSYMLNGKTWSKETTKYTPRIEKP